MPSAINPSRKLIITDGWDLQTNSKLPHYLLRPPIFVNTWLMACWEHRLLSSSIQLEVGRQYNQIQKCGEEKSLEMSHVILVSRSVYGFKYGIEFQSGCLKVMPMHFPSSLDRNNNQLAWFAKNTHKYMDTQTKVDNSPVMLTYQVWPSWSRLCGGRGARRKQDWGDEGKGRSSSLFRVCCLVSPLLNFDSLCLLLGYVSLLPGGFVVRWEGQLEALEWWGRGLGKCPGRQ